MSETTKRGRNDDLHDSDDVMLEHIHDALMTEGYYVVKNFMSPDVMSSLTSQMPSICAAIKSLPSLDAIFNNGIKEDTGKPAIYPDPEVEGAELNCGDEKRMQAFVKNIYRSKKMPVIFKDFLRSYLNQLESLFAAKSRTPEESVIILSDPGCEHQTAHCDYDPDDLRNLTYDDGFVAGYPIACMLALMPNTYLNVWPKSMNLQNPESTTTDDDCFVIFQHERICWNQGDLLLFRGDLVHAGHSYSSTLELPNIRIHTYLDVDHHHHQKGPAKRHNHGSHQHQHDHFIPDNKTFFMHEHPQIGPMHVQ
jgi:hypothetical protein